MLKTRLVDELMSHTACVCSQPDETVLQFTNRVKADIALQGGLVDLDWSVALSYIPSVFSDFVSVSL